MFAPTLVKVMPDGAQIAADARRYIGEGYVYGGTAGRPGDWDCSSFVSYVLGHDLGLTLPGGRWGEPSMPPNVHGPVVLDYVQWPGADPVPLGQEQPGDLICWPGVGAGGHIGIVQGVNLMVSALDSAQGTAETQFMGPTPTYVLRRVTGTGPAPAPGSGPGSGGWGDVLYALAAGAAVGAGAVILVTLGMLAAAGGVGWLGARAARRAAGGVDR
jgi:cell wall-associated NlpC family hydrolase